MRRFFMFLFFCFCLCSALIAQQDVRLTTYDGELVRPTNPLPVDASATIGSITVSVFPVYADESGTVATCSVDAENRAKVNIASDTIGLITSIASISGDVSRSEASVSAAVSAVETEVASGNVTINTSVNAVETAISAVETEVASGNVTINTSVNAVETAISAVETAIASPISFSETNETLVSNTVSDITAIANRRNISIRAYYDNTEIIWIKFDSETASAAVGTGFPLHPGALVTLALPDNFDVSAISSGAESLYVAQQGD